MSFAVAQPAATTREVVLAVDDNEQNLELLEEYLWTWGYEPVLARSGREALDLYPECDPALVILDVMMPELDGYETCRLLKSSPAGRAIPVLMLTALTGADEKITALQSGADDFLNKPINRDELRTRIRSLIRIRGLRRELDSSENIIMALTSALESKDAMTMGHVQRVADYAVRLCDRLGLPPDGKEIVRKGAMLHDVGMIGVPDHLLTARPRSNEERSRILDHTRVGASILEPMLTFQPFVPIVRWHHERWDGRGYPDGLKGAEIPLDAQIVAIANRFDEIANEDGAGHDEGMRQLLDEGERGAFDPELAREFAMAFLEGAPRPAVTRHLDRQSRPVPRVLCVDDSTLNRKLVGAAIADAGMHATLAADGIEAMRLLERERFDVVLLDLVMPEQDGATTLAELRADPRWEFLPVIVLTSHRDSALRQEAIVAGADDFLNYPLNRVELVTRIQSLLRIRDYHADLEQTQNVICALALALEAKDEYTRGHSQRVGDLARMFALHVGVSSADAERIRIAGLLHDIGKIAVPGSLLNKEGALTREEFMRVIDHPVIGADMVRPLTTLASVLEMIRHHHERYDGRGYPDGLRGDAIPYEVRLLSVVDAYDALTSERAYRPSPLSHQAAIGTLRREASGGKWDPVMVDQFASMLGAEGPRWDEITMPAPMLRVT